MSPISPPLLHSSKLISLPAQPRVSRYTGPDPTPKPLVETEAVTEREENIVIIQLKHPSRRSFTGSLFTLGLFMNTISGSMVIEGLVCSADSQKSSVFPLSCNIVFVTK